MDKVSENTRCGGPERKQVHHSIRKQSRSELETVNGMGNTAMGRGHSEDYSRNLGKKTRYSGKQSGRGCGVLSQQ